jgi:mono/diheme cytochrome c family protein
LRYCLLALLALAAGAASVSTRGAAPPPRDEIARGEYLVDHVAMCSECHTPRDENGDLDASRYLQGGPNWLLPVHPTSRWASRAPALAGLSSYDDSQVETVLEEGVGPNRMPLQAPMHVYRMDRADARAVIAYLKSLPEAVQ